MEVDIELRTRSILCGGLESVTTSARADPSTTSADRILLRVNFNQELAFALSFCDLDIYASLPKMSV